MNTFTRHLLAIALALPTLAGCLEAGDEPPMAEARYAHGKSDQGTDQDGGQDFDQGGGQGADQGSGQDVDQGGGQGADQGGGGVAECFAAINEHASLMLQGDWSTDDVDDLLDACGVAGDSEARACVEDVWDDLRMCERLGEEGCGGHLRSDLLDCVGAE